MALATAVRHYLHEVLGIPTPSVKPWARENELPYFLRDTFQFGEIELLGHSIVLAMGRAEQKQSLSEVRTWLHKVRALAGQPAVYVTDALASYERRRLIEQKIPFIVPGNQLYLPDLGLDLREYFRQRSPTAESALSPSAQAMLITALLHQPWQAEWQPSTVAVALGYTPMTLSRVVKELTAAGLAAAYTVGRSRWLRMEQPPQQTWERAKPLLRTPVKRTVWVLAEDPMAKQLGRLAGLSALVLGKGLVLLAVARKAKLEGAAAFSLAVLLAQGGEFAFVLFGAGKDTGLLEQALVDLLIVSVTLSMAITPVLVLLRDVLIKRMEQRGEVRPFDTIEGENPRVIIAGYGRFGQIVSRTLRARRIRFTVLEKNPTQVDFVRRFGNLIYYGDAARIDLLRTAGIEQAEVFVLAVDDPEESVKVAEAVRHAYPNLHIVGRARNRPHAYALMALGIKDVIRETFHSSLEAAALTLEAVGLPAVQAVGREAPLVRAHGDHRLAGQQSELPHDGQAAAVGVVSVALNRTTCGQSNRAEARKTAMTILNTNIGEFSLSGATVTTPSLRKAARHSSTAETAPVITQAPARNSNAARLKFTA